MAEEQVRIDKEGDYTYVGKAAPGEATSASTWRISRIDESASPDIILLWADGDVNYDNAWDSRATLSYS